MASAAPASPTVILTDRNRHVRELLAREFAKAGFEVRCFGLGREAACVAEREGDVLVVDGDLPDMDAASVVRKVRLSRPRIPVAVHGHDREEAGESLADALVFFVPKADDPALLVGRVLEVLGAASGSQGGADRNS